MGLPRLHQRTVNGHRLRNAYPATLSRPGQRAANDSHDGNSHVKVFVVSCVQFECLDTAERQIRDQGKP
jgi:hypothetical protein